MQHEFGLEHGAGFLTKPSSVAAIHGIDLWIALRWTSAT